MEKLIKFSHIMIYSEYVFCCFFQLSDTFQTPSPTPISPPPPRCSEQLPLKFQIWRLFWPMFLPYYLFIFQCNFLLLPVVLSHPFSLLPLTPTTIDYNLGMKWNFLDSCKYHTQAWIGSAEYVCHVFSVVYHSRIYSFNTFFSLICNLWFFFQLQLTSILY